MAEVRSSAISGVAIAPEVTQLVEYVWEEASGCLGEVLSLPVESVKLEQVEKAEAALLSIRRLLDQGKRESDEGKGKRYGEMRGEEKGRRIEGEGKGETMRGGSDEEEAGIKGVSCLQTFLASQGPSFCLLM